VESEGGYENNHRTVLLREEAVLICGAQLPGHSGVFIHRAIPLGPDAVMNVLTDITGQRRLEAELERHAQVAADDLREPLTAVGLFVEQPAVGLDRGRDERNERLVALLRPTRARARWVASAMDGEERSDERSGATALKAIWSAASARGLPHGVAAVEVLDYGPCAMSNAKTTPSSELLRCGVRQLSRWWSGTSSRALDRR
jgi:hypothetical protein